MWIIYALFSAFFYAAATMFTKYSVSKVVRDNKGIVVLHAIAAFGLISVLWVLVGMPVLGNAWDLILALISGALIGVAATFYFKAFNMEDASVVTLLTQVIVPLTLIAGLVFLGDSVKVLQILAAIIILSGVVIVTWSRKGFHLHSTKVLPIMACATVATTTVLILSKAVLNRSDTITFTFYQTIGYLVYSALNTIVMPSMRRGFMKNMRPFHPKMLAIIGTSEILFLLAILAQFKAFTLVNAGLVLSVGASEVFISIILGFILTKTVPHLISEKIDKKTINRKIIAGVLIVAGISVLNFVS